MERSRSRGCSCGYVRYRADGAATDATCCHCSICRRTSGAPFVGLVHGPGGVIPGGRGEPDRPPVVRARHAHVLPALRSTPLTFRSSHTPAELDVTTCSLDNPEAVPPADHTWTSARLSWVKLDDGLPTFPAAPRDEGARPEGDEGEASRARASEKVAVALSKCTATPQEGRCAAE